MPVLVGLRDTLMRRDLFESELQRKIEAPYVRSCCTPRMTDAYREKVTSHCQALEHEDSGAGAAEAIRGLIKAVLLEPDGEPLKITLRVIWLGC